MAVVEGKKILIVSLNIPFPLTHGGAIAQYFFLKELSLVHEITLCTHTQNETDQLKLAQLAALLPHLKINYSTTKDQPAPKSIVRNLAGRSYRWLKKRFIHSETGRTDLDELTLENNFTFCPPNFISFLQDHLKQTIYDVIQLEFLETISLLPLLPDSTKKIYICHEIKNKRIQNLNCMEENDVYRNYIMNFVKTIEENFMKMADERIVFTEEDKKFLSASGIPSVVSAFGIPDELIKKRMPSECYNRFLFIGKEGFWPNREGLKWFLEEIYLPNEKIISWPIFVVGEWTEKFKSEFNHPKIKFTGFAEQIESFFTNSVLISPVLSGSGLRTKILLAFANKVPVMSTPFASEGLNDHPAGHEHILHFESAKEFIDHFGKFENDPKLLKDLAVSAYEFYKNNFETQQLVNKRNEIY